MTRRLDRTLADAEKTEWPRIAGAPASPSEDWIRSIPDALLEPHPLVRGLRLELREKAASLADKQREIARLEAALAFGLKRLPVDRSSPGAPS